MSKKQLVELVQDLRGQLEESRSLEREWGTDCSDYMCRVSGCRGKIEYESWNGYCRDHASLREKQT